MQAKIKVGDLFVIWSPDGGRNTAIGTVTMVFRFGSYRWSQRFGVWFQFFYDQRLQQVDRSQPVRLELKYEGEEVLTIVIDSATTPSTEEVFIFEAIFASLAIAIQMSAQGHRHSSGESGFTFDDEDYLRLAQNMCQAPPHFHCQKLTE